MPRQARTAASTASGMNISPARSRCVPAPMAMTAGTTSCTRPVPRLPPAALSPRALPFSASGKKKEMFVIEEAKLPPPKPARAAQPEQQAERRRRVAHDPGEGRRGDEQQECRDDGPVASAEARDGEGVGDAHRRADQAGDGDEPELLVQGEAEAGGREQRHDHAPQRPDAEAEELGEDRQAEVASRDRPAAAAPEGRVLRVPVVDPATRTVGRCRGGGSRAGRCRRGRGVARGQVRGHAGSVASRCFAALRPP